MNLEAHTSFAEYEKVFNKFAYVTYGVFEYTEDLHFTLSSSFQTLYAGTSI